MCFLIKTRYLFTFFLFFNLICGFQYLVVVKNDNDTICYNDKEECEWSYTSNSSGTYDQRIPLNFSFPMFQNSSRRLFLSSNGYLRFNRENPCRGDIDKRICQLDFGSYDLSIAGILTDFDPIIYDDSNIYYYSDEERFEAYYENMRTKDCIYNFTFSISLFPSGIVQISYHDVESYNVVVRNLSSHLDYTNKYYFYYSGIIGSKGKDYQYSNLRDENKFNYGTKHHNQIEYVPYGRFQSNYTVMFCPMPEKFCVTPYFIDTFDGGDVHITGDIISCENEISIRCLLSVDGGQRVVQAEIKNNEIICNIPPYRKFKSKKYMNESTDNFKNSNLRKNEPNIISIKLEYLTYNWNGDGKEKYENYPINYLLAAAFIDFDDKEENYTAISCDASDINTCDKCGVCGGNNECVICDSETLYFTDCESNCSYVEEEYYNDECVPLSYFDCFGEYNGIGVVSKSSIGTGNECCDKKVDCYGSCDGTAIIDKCDNCIYGATGKTERDSYDCYFVCNGTRKPPCNSTILYDKENIVLEHEIDNEMSFVDTIIPFNASINGTAAIKFTSAFIYPQIPYYPKIDVYVSDNGTSYYYLSSYVGNDVYFMPNKTIYFRLIAITSRFNSYSAKAVERHRITISYLPIFDRIEQRIMLEVYLTYRNCERRKGYEQCYLPGCSFCISNGGFNVATNAKTLDGVCVDGNVSMCRNLINKPNDGYMFIFCNLWLFVIVVFIL